jgi:hypothetical protein
MRCRTIRDVLRSLEAFYGETPQATVEAEIGTPDSPVPLGWIRRGFARQHRAMLCSVNDAVR